MADGEIGFVLNQQHKWRNFYFSEVNHAAGGSAAV